MSQIRVLEPQDSKHAKDLKDMGLRFCTKDKRWEKNGGTSKLREIAADIVRHLPGVKVQLKEGGKDEDIHEDFSPDQALDLTEFKKDLQDPERN